MLTFVRSAPSSAWVALVAAASGVFLTSLDITVNVALPEIADSFGAEASAVQWIIILYVGASAAMQLALGAAADAAGLKRMYVFGLAAYTAAVVAIGLSDDLGVVFGLRTLQAVGNGLLMALSPALVTRAFPAEFRGRALGATAALGTMGMVAGSLGGGALVDAFGWRSIFLARAPICAAAIFFSVVFLRTPNDSAARRGAPDMRGAAAQFVGVGSLILALSLGGRIGWADWRVAALGAASAAGLWAFFTVERRSERPFLRLSDTGGALPIALAVTALAYLGMFVNWFILPFFVVDGMGASASAWGGLLLMMTLATALSAPLGGWLSDRWRPARSMSGALAIGCAALIWMSGLEPDSAIWEVAVGLLASGAATGLFQSASANLIMGTMPRDRLGAGGGAMGLARGLGTALSVAVMGAAFAALESARAAQPSAGGGDAFASTFQDTYRIAALICAAALAASFALWRRRE